MAGNSEFELVTERGWRRGLGNQLNVELARWWKTSRWWRQSLVWTIMIVAILAAVVFDPKGFSLETGATLYAILAGIFPAVGVVIFMQDVLVGEKREGTAAWVLSKPVSRPAFLLAKVIANSLGVLGSVVLIPAIASFILLSVAGKSILNPLAFVAAIGVLFLSLFFFLTLTLMLGTFFNTRGPVIGIGLGLLLGQQYILGLLPLFKYILPWTLTIPIDNLAEAVVPALLMGNPILTYIPMLMVALESILFIVIAVLRFEREEF